MMSPLTKRPAVIYGPARAWQLTARGAPPPHASTTSVAFSAVAQFRSAVLALALAATASAFAPAAKPASRAVAMQFDIAVRHREGQMGED